MPTRNESTALLARLLGRLRRPRRGPGSGRIDRESLAAIVYQEVTRLGPGSW